MGEAVKVVCVFGLIAASLVAAFTWNNDQPEQLTWILRVVSLAAIPTALAGFLWAHFRLPPPAPPVLKSRLAEEPPDPHAPWYADRHAGPPVSAAESDNPFEAAQTESDIPGDPRLELERIAACQKAVIGCLLGYVGFLGLALVMMSLGFPTLSAAVRYSFIALALLLAATSAVCVFLLARKVYSLPIALVLLPLMFLSPLNLLVLLAVNSRASRLLTAHGLHIGLFGVDRSQFHPEP